MMRKRWLMFFGLVWVGTLCGFLELPVQEGGRVKPLDSVGQVTLLILSGRERVPLPQGGSLSYGQFITELLLNPQQAGKRPVFRVDHDQVKAFLGTRDKWVSFEVLAPHAEAFLAKVAALPKEPQQQDALERQWVKLHESMVLYRQLSHSLLPEGLEGSEERLRQEIAAGVRALRAQEAGLPYTAAHLDRLVTLTHGFLNTPGQLGLLPIADAAWAPLGSLLLETLMAKPLPEVLSYYWEAAAACQRGDGPALEQKSARIYALMPSLLPAETLRRVATEYRFNQINPFFFARCLYVASFVLSAFFWLWPKRFLWVSGWSLAALALLLHTLGLVARIYISGRPPVTNLYSSALFVGWGASLLAWVLEARQRQALLGAVGALVGFSTLWIAKSLGSSGDTLELLRAVLDTNFWLSTHVIMVNLGYGAVILAGTLSALALLHATFSGKTRVLLAVEPRVYGLVCFGLLLSFVGTLLGGIWADQSWGRFWGWDPKENGALLIVLWLAILLHARVGKYVGPRGFLVLGVGCNIVTSWSWFGTNMLGIGLHAYGFMDRAFPYLAAVILIHLGIMLIGLGRVRG